MKLKFLGHICPECGEKCYTSGYRHGFTRYRSRADGWIGFYYWSCCYRCSEAYLILFDQDNRFVSIVANGDGSMERLGVMYEAGRVDVDEIPF